MGTERARQRQRETEKETIGHYTPCTYLEEVTYSITTIMYESDRDRQTDNDRDGQRETDRETNNRETRTEYTNVFWKKGLFIYILYCYNAIYMHIYRA